jgi:transcription initiation factor TFIIA large subunit
MAHAPNTGIEELYRSVIQEVIEQSKEAALDENIDAEILCQIQKAWEDKINASGAADLNPKVQPVPPVRPNQAKPQHSGRPSSSAARGGGGNDGPSMVVRENLAPSTSHNQPHYVTAADLPSMFRNAGGAVQFQGLQYLQSGMGQFVSVNPGNLPPNVMLLPVQMSGNPSGANVIQMTQEQLNQLPQNDGECFIPDLENAEISLDLKAGTLTIDTSRSQDKKAEESDEKKIEATIKNIEKLEMKAKAPTKKMKTMNLAMIIPQVDGGPHMSDSSSDDEDDDDPMSRIVNRIDDKGEEEGEDDGGDEDPLNSNDDQSDDEDLDTLFESSNIIVCQFEKVNRARNKWKFTLKDGIMHLEGKDYCFQKCTGEAEW